MPKKPYDTNGQKQETKMRRITRMDLFNKASQYTFPGTILRCFFLVTIFCSGTQAETLNNVGDLKKGTRMTSYLFSKTTEAMLLETSKFWEKKLNQQQECNESSLRFFSLMLHKPISYPQDQSHPSSGAWQHRFIVNRCGITKIYNTIFVANNGAPPNVIPFYPGTSSASLQLLGDAKMSGELVAFSKMKSQGLQKVCKDIQLIDTKLIKPPHDVTENDKTFKDVWHEEWTFSGCGFTATVTAIFIPDGSGGTTFSFR